jgi:hypothetical protein
VVVISHSIGRAPPGHILAQTPRQDSRSSGPATFKPGSSSDARAIGGRDGMPQAIYALLGPVPDPLCNYDAPQIQEERY